MKDKTNKICSYKHFQHCLASMYACTVYLTYCAIGIYIMFYGHSLVDALVLPLLLTNLGLSLVE